METNCEIRRAIAAELTVETLRSDESEAVPSLNFADSI